MTQEFRSNSLELSARLLAEHLLRYLRVEPGTKHPSRIFVFDDPKNLGPTYEAEFFNGQPMVAVKDYEAAVKMLREKFVSNPTSRGASHGAIRA